MGTEATFFTSSPFLRALRVRLIVSGIGGIPPNSSVQAGGYGTTAVASISTRARSSSSPATTTSVIAG
jgi:hypothetical protein